jgi:hypothetical protein
VVSRDYSSFSSAAKSRFKPIADALGYEQLSGVFYAKPRDGWYEVFQLQAASHGNTFFYVNYGISVPKLFPVSQPEELQGSGLLLWDRLRDSDGKGGFGSETKSEIEESARQVLEQYKTLALPWFAERSSWDSIAAEYYRTNPIDEDEIGAHSVDFGADFRSATYAYLLLKAGRQEDAKRWLLEAQRMMRLPIYLTRDGRTVHTMEKFARLQKPEPYEVERLREVEGTLQALCI